jgi:hypothetical protein
MNINLPNNDYTSYYNDFWSDSYKERLIKKYTDLGIKRDKIFISKMPSIATWSLSKGCLVNEDNSGDVYDLIPTNDGNFELSMDNNRTVSMSAYELGNPETMKFIDVEKINNSEGIIITGATYGKENRLRYGFVPHDDREKTFSPKKGVAERYSGKLTKGMKESAAELGLDLVEVKPYVDERLEWMKEYAEMLSEKPSKPGTFSKEKKIGYHLSDIPKGELGTSSKIEEELNELKDAEKQNSKIMMMIELSDLYGALEEYCIRVGLSINDLKTFSDITKRAFRNGKRK